MVAAAMLSVTLVIVTHRDDDDDAMMTDDAIIRCVGGVMFEALILMAAGAKEGRVGVCFLCAHRGGACRRPVGQR